MFSIYSLDVDRIPLLSKEEKEEIDHTLGNGSTEEEKAEARKKLVVSCLRLSSLIAKEYIGMGVELDDLIQEGNRGAMYSAERYDPNYGVAFSAYATRAIRYHILRELIKQSRYTKKFRAASLDACVEDNLSFGETIENPREGLPDKLVEENELCSKLCISMARLDKKDAELIRRRYGFNGYKRHTYREIAVQIKRSGERVRQRINDALETLGKELEILS